MEERRTARRIPVTFRASFSLRPEGAGEGTIVDLTPRGCCVESPIPVPVTTHLELRLELSLGERPILVDLAAVRWVRGSHMGVEFLSLRPEHQVRLLRIIDQGQEGGSLRRIGDD